jgi:hypothetical protein
VAAHPIDGELEFFRGVGAGGIAHEIFGRWNRDYSRVNLPAEVAAEGDDIRVANSPSNALRPATVFGRLRALRRDADELSVDA